MYGISQREGIDARIFISSSFPAGMETVNDIATDQPMDSSDTMLVTWTPGLGARDEVICFSIQVRFIEC